MWSRSLSGKRSDFFVLHGVPPRPVPQARDRRGVCFPPMNYSPTLAADQLFDAVWREEFLPLIAEKRRVRTEQQTEAFLDTTLTLCGVEVRQMTPSDLLLLDALDNPFVCGGETGFVDALAVIWQLAADNDHTSSWCNLWRRARARHRLEVLPYPEIHEAVVGFVARMFLASPDEFYRAAEPGTGDAFAPELKTHFLSPLLVGLCSTIGPTDPMSGELLADTPLPRLFQYQATNAQSAGEKQYNETDSLRNRCLERTAQIIHGSAAPRHESAVGSAKADSPST